MCNKCKFFFILEIVDGRILILNDCQHGLPYLVVNLLSLLCQLVKISTFEEVPLGSNDATQYMSIVGALRYLTLTSPI